MSYEDTLFNIINSNNNLLKIKFLKKSNSVYCGDLKMIKESLKHCIEQALSCKKTESSSTK